MQEVYYKPHRQEYKRILRAECEERKKEWDKLTTMEKITSLDQRLGPNVGAKKQRARLKEQLEAEMQKKIRAEAAKQQQPDEEVDQNGAQRRQHESETPKKKTKKK